VGVEGLDDRAHYEAVLLEGRRIGTRAHFRREEDSTVTEFAGYVFYVELLGIVCRCASARLWVETRDGLLLESHRLVEKHTSRGKRDRREIRTGRLEADGSLVVHTCLDGVSKTQTIREPIDADSPEPLRTLSNGLKTRLSSLVTLRDWLFVVPEPKTIPCSREEAFSRLEVGRLLASPELRCPDRLKSSMDDLRSSSAIVYELEQVGDAPRKLRGVPETAHQKVRASGDGKLIVTIRKDVEIPEDAPFPYKGTDRVALSALKASPDVESEDALVVKLARRAVADARTAWDAALNIHEFVLDYLTARDTVEYATAAEVARVRKGDCWEHSVFLAALCRAAGVPARLVNGVHFPGYPRAFGLHFWVEVYIGGRWLGLETTPGDSARVDATYIVLEVAGEGDEFEGHASTFVLRYQIVDIKAAEGLISEASRPAS
jgi:hypothetical protein